MEGDIFESFIPFTKKRSSRAFCSQSSISLSQRSSINSKQRNLLGFFKPKVDISSTFVETQNEFLKPNEPERCKNAISKLPKDGTKPTMENEEGYCPTCQVPLSCLGVQPDVHAFSCSVSWITLEECSFGEACNETNIFHFRDYAHSKLAQLRATTSCQTPTSRKRRISVSNSESSSTNSNILLDSPVRNYQSSSKLTVRKKFTSSSSDSVTCSSKVKDLYDQLVINDNCVDNISPEIEPVTVNESTKITTNPISEKELIISPERVSKSLNFKGNVIYKDKVEPSFSSRKCVRADTIPCEECLCNMIGQAPTETEEIETCVEMTLSPQSNKTIQSPIKVQLMYNQLGWQSMGLDAKPEADVEEVAVKVCSCSHCIEMECTVADTNSNTSVACQRNRCTSDLQSKVFVNLEGLGITTNTSKSVPTLHNRHMCITSTLNSNGSSSTKLEVSSGNTKLVEGSNPSVSNMDTVSVPSVDTAVLEDEVSTADKMYAKNAAAKEKWKELLVGMKSKGFNSMSVLSDDSISATAHQYADMAVRDKNTKQCPFYKRIPDTSFVVDAFQYGIIPRITHYFLSHFHADHYGGLKKSFKKPIICSAITARLVKKKLGVDSCYLNVIELDRPLSIRQVTVTALDANHCPGSVMFLFQLLDGRNFLHVGDFRADADMESYPCFWNLNIDKLFLDTTPC